MKIFVFLIVMANMVSAAPTEKAKILPVTKEEMVKNEKLKMLDKKEEDCDKKAKKPVEIKPEAISLTGGLGAAGCTLPE